MNYEVGRQEYGIEWKVDEEDRSDRGFISTLLHLVSEHNRIIGIYSISNIWKTPHYSFHMHGSDTLKSNRFTRLLEVEPLHFGTGV